MTPPGSGKPRLFLLGDARQVHLSRWAAYFDEAGYDILTFTLEEPHTEYPGRVHRARVPEALPHAARYPLAARSASRLVHAFDPHVVNAHFVPNYGVIASLVGREPWVMSAWGSDIMTDPDKSAFHMWRTRRVLSRAAHVTSDAEVMSERLRRLGVAPGKILTFPFGVDVGRFHPAAAPIEEGPRIISNRKLEAVYSVSTIIDAFTGIREALPHASLTVAGDGSQRTVLMRRAARSIATAAVTFVGDVDHTRVPVLLRENNVYVSTALSDTTSVSLLEAMACGLFPVVTDIPANREWVTNGENGALVPPAEPMRLAMAVIDAWRDPALRERARRINVEIVRERAEWRRSMHGVHELFDALAAARAA
jgi:glycosyltransferase involved in cell wall biosynthesis